MSILIGVDIGTSNIKVIAFKNDNQIRISEKSSCDIILSTPGKVEQSPQLVLQTVNTLLKSVITQLKGATIEGVCFSAAMHSLLAVDKENHPLTNAILWSDIRSREEAHHLKTSGIAETLYQQTGVPIHPSLPLCKIMWLKENSPDLFAQTYKFISLKEYLFFQWFGKYIVDHSIAGATGMQDIHSLQWSEPALSIAGIQKEQLSQIVPVTHIETRLTDPYRNYFGIGEIPFIIGSSDGCLANLGSGVLGPDKAALTIGTSGAVRTTTSSPILHDSAALFCYPLLKNQFIKGGAVNNGGNILSWFGRNFRDDPSSPGKDLTSLINQAHAMKAGADGLIFLPYLYGERAPIWDANARGVFFGVSAMHHRGHFARAVMEGICFGLYDVFSELLQFEKNIKTISASGGFVQSDLWVQMIADIFDIEVTVNDQADASTIGAALTGWYAIGAVNRMQDSGRNAGEGRVFLPDKNKHHIYRKNFEIFRSLYDALRNEFPKLNVGGAGSEP